jgi:hypothetical protein
MGRLLTFWSCREAFSMQLSDSGVNPASRIFRSWCDRDFIKPFRFRLRNKANFAPEPSGTLSGRPPPGAS